MKELSSEQIAKLPKWAQSAFKILMRENADLKNAISEMQGNVTDDTYSTVLKHGYGNDPEVIQNINGMSGIDIKLQPRLKFDKRTIRVMVKDDQLEVMGTGHPSHLILIPQAANVVRFALADNNWEL